MPIIEVDGIGRIEFPEGMTDDQIAEAIYSNYPELKPADQLDQNLAPEQNPIEPVIDGETGAALQKPELSFTDKVTNIASAAGERAGDVAGALLSGIDITAKSLEEKYPLGGFHWNEGDTLPTYMSGKEFAEKQPESILGKPAESLQSIDLGYTEQKNWQDVKDTFSKEGALSASAYADVVEYGLEQGLKSVPDMVGAVFAMPAYLMARTEEIGQERARNKGKEGAELEDLLEAAPFAIGSSLLERIGAKGITSDIAENIGKEILKDGVKSAAKKIAKEGGKGLGKEAVTEAIQEGMIEYVGEKFGTDASMSFSEALDRGVAGAVAGGVTGGAISTATTTGLAAKEGIGLAEEKFAPGRVLGREMERQLAGSEFVDNAGDIAKGALSPEMAQIKATPEAEKSVAMLVKEKLFDKGVDLTVPMDTIPTQPLAQLPEPIEDRRAEGEDRKERRKETNLRKKVSAMTAEEKEKALLSSDKTGMKNERAYEEDDRLDYQSFFDIDNFKELNTKYSYDGADQILSAFGKIMTRAESDQVKAYHLHGDEFVVQSSSEEALRAFSEKVQKELQSKDISISLEGSEPKTASGVGATFGIGKSKEDAETNLKTYKDKRAEKGLRTDREKPTKLKTKGKEIVETPISEITLSKDVPQFKEGADKKGVVEALGGKFDRVGVAPIQIWVRKDGRKEVVTGRHRLDLATRSGEKTIPAQYHYESEGFGASQAAELDAILNIREGQGKVKDYVEFIKATKLTEKEAGSQGILARATGKRAYTIATRGSDTLIASHRNNAITDEAAVRIANAAPKNETLQAVGIKAIQDGKTIVVAENLVKAVSSMTGGQEATGDMFGFDDSAMKEAEALAKKAIAKQSEIQRTLSAIQGATKRPDLAKKEGIDVKNPEAIKKRIEELKEEKRKWNTWHTNPELVAELKGDGFSLPQETEEQRLAREKEEQAATKSNQDKEKAADDKAKADQEVGGFTLTGSDRTADEAEARGQNSLFDESAEYSKVSKLNLSVGDLSERQARKHQSFITKEVPYLNDEIDVLSGNKFNSVKIKGIQKKVRQYEKEYAFINNKFGAVKQKPKTKEIDTSTFKGRIEHSISRMGDLDAKDLEEMSISEQIESVSEIMEFGLPDHDGKPLSALQKQLIETASKKLIDKELSKKGDIFESEAEYEGLSSTKEEAHKSASENVKKTINVLDKIQGSMLANAIAKDYKKSGVTSLIGQRINNSEDLAVAAQIYRNPSFETFRFFIMKGDFVVGQTGVTSRRPGETKLFPDKQGYDKGIQFLREKMHSLNADGFYMLHNHPSGTMSPSQADKNATKHMARDLRGFKGHVIVNQKQYVLIDTDHLWEAKGITNLNPEYDINKPAKTGELLGKKIGGPDDFALVGTEYYRPDWVVIVGRQGATGKVNAIMEIPVSAISSRTDTQLIAYIKKFQTETGSVDVALANVPRAIHRKVDQAVINGWLIDAIDVDGKSFGGPLHKARNPKHKALDVVLKEKESKYNRTVEGVSYRKNFTVKGMQTLEVAYKGYEPLTEEQTLDKVEKLQGDGPMPNNPPMYAVLEARGEMPKRKPFFFLRGKKIKNGSEYNPQKREGIITHVKAIIGNRLYTNRIKSKSVLGFYNAVNGETRLKKYGDIEVLSHEMAHYLDFFHKFSATIEGKSYRRTKGKKTRKESVISKMYSHGINAKEVESFSYTSKNSLILSEGFAEYIRAWLTNYEFAKKNAPNFTKEFEAYLKKDKKFERKMLGLQIKMHKWFLQGDKARLIDAISGERDPNKSLTAGERIMRMRSREVAGEFKQFVLDYLHAAKVMSRTVKGKLSTGINEPYKLLQLLHGADQIFAESYFRGAPYYKDDGSLGFNGMSLHKVWGTSKKAGNKRMKDQEAYFAARRAVEATRKGTEKLFTHGMIKEGLALAKKFPYFEKAFSDFQIFNEQMLDFYVESGYISLDAKQAFLRNNQAYVAFHRAITSRSNDGGGSNIGARQSGAEESILHIYQNTVRQTGIHLAAALKERALRNLITQTLGRGTEGEGGQFITKATTDVKRIAIDVEQIADSILQVGTENQLNVKDLGFEHEGVPITTRRDFIEYLEANPDLIKFWTFGHAPKDKKTDFISYIEEGTGKTKWVQINEDNTLFPSMLDALNGVHLPQNKMIKGLLLLPIYFKNLKTVFITSAWQFAGGNIFRDSATALALSNFKFKPVYHHLIGLGHMIESLWNANGLVGELRGNGGYSGGRTKSVMYENWGLTGSNSEYLADKDWYRSPARIAKEIALLYTKVADVSEMATRVGFYYAARKSGVDPVEAAWQTRQITTDFQKRGANPHLAYVIRTAHFLNAGMQGFSREMEAIFEVKGEMKLSNWYKDENGRITLASVKTKMYGAMMTIAGLSMMSAYLMLTSDDEEEKEIYKNLTPDERARFMFWPGGNKTPKPIGIFGFAASLGDIGINNHLDPGEHKDFLTDETLFAAGYHMVVMGTPAMLELPLDLISGKDWKGAPIVPEKLKDVMAFEQYNSRTGLGYIELSKALKDKFDISLSPIKTEYVVKSTMGYYSEYVKEYTDRMFWDYEKFGERPFQKTFGDISFRQFKKDERIYRNKYTSKFYELYHESIVTADSWRTAMDHLKEVGDKDYEKNYGQYEHTLKKLQSKMQTITKEYNNWQKSVLIGNRDPNLSAKEKETAEIKRLKSRNVILESSYKQMKDALEKAKKAQEALKKEKK